MNNIATTLPRSWWSIDLPGYRDFPTSSTYYAFDYEALPPIPEPLDDRFDWLLREPLQEENSLEMESDPEDAERFQRWYKAVFLCRLDAHTEDIQATFADLGDSLDFPLPPPFVTFMESPALQARIRSCTACFLELPDYPVRVVGSENGWLIHFLSDQQWCLHWYLYLNAHGEHSVLVSGPPYGFEDEDGERKETIDLREAEGIWFCAPSFSEFLYRFWIENEIWFALACDHEPLTEHQKAYAEHYTRST